MKINEILVSPALSVADGEVIIPVKGKGTSWVIGVRQWLPNVVDFPPIKYASTPKVYLAQTSEHIHGICTEGSPLILTINLREAHDVDVTGTWTITTEEDGLVIGSIPVGVVSGMHSDADNIEDTYDNFNRLSLLADADLPLKTDIFTIPAGETTVEVSVDTTDDAVYTGGPNTYKVGTVTVTNDQDLNIQGEGVVLIMDASPVSLCNGNVSVSGRVHDLLPVESVIDPSTENQLSMAVGTGSQSYMIDDTPLTELRFTPVGIVFNVQDGGVDPNGTDYLYQLVIQAGDLK